MLVKLCARNYDTLDGLVNGVDEAFKDFTQISWKSFIWIQFYNSKIENKTRTKFCTFMNNSL
jgi:hypothetical protein